MGLFDKLKSVVSNPSGTTVDKLINNTPNVDVLNSPNRYADSSSVSPDEKPYYQPDTYYTYYSYPGTMMATRVITFEERKKNSYPSARGLYVAEIMLLEYCKNGKYPKPKSGYPGFWWFKYGIRDVGHALQSLQERGFIQWGSKYDMLNGLKVDELKNILTTNGVSANGKKADLIDRIVNSIPEQNIIIPDYTPKYTLTEIGKMELEDNGYVPYMHNHRHLTTEDSRAGQTFTVWDINRLFANGDAPGWRKVVGNIELQRFVVDMANASSVEANESNKDQGDKSVLREEIRRYLASKKTDIDVAIKTPGDGFEEESKGLDLKKVGNDKDALVLFYISIGKKFDAPALYRETRKILKKYDMFEEELLVIDAEMKNVKNCNKTELLDRKNKIYKLIQNKNNK